MAVTLEHIIDRGMRGKRVSNLVYSNNAQSTFIVNSLALAHYS